MESCTAAVEDWVDRFPGREIHVAVEACTGWLFVARALERKRRAALGGAGGDERAARPQTPREDRLGVFHREGRVANLSFKLQTDPNCAKNASGRRSDGRGLRFVQ